MSSKNPFFQYISSFDIFLKLFSAGIKRVTVNPEALIEGDLSDIAFGALFEVSCVAGSK